MIDAYYEINGWDKDGIPLKATLEKYGLNQVIYRHSLAGALPQTAY